MHVSFLAFIFTNVARHLAFLRIQRPPFQQNPNHSLSTSTQCAQIQRKPRRHCIGYCTVPHPVEKKKERSTDVHRDPYQSGSVSIQSESDYAGQISIQMCSYTYSWYYCNHDYYIWFVGDPPSSNAPSIIRSEELTLGAGPIPWKFVPHVCFLVTRTIFGALTCART